MTLHVSPRATYEPVQKDVMSIVRCTEGDHSKLMSSCERGSEPAQHGYPPGAIQSPQTLFL